MLFTGILYGEIVFKDGTATGAIWRPQGKEDIIYPFRAKSFLSKRSMIFSTPSEALEWLSGETEST